MKVSTDVLVVLDAAEVSGSTVVLDGQLERKLYVATNKVLEAAGGKWNRHARAHVFDGDAATLLEQVILTGEITTAQELGYFPTPERIVEQMIDLADLLPGMSVLEPSAGDGAIVLPLLRAGYETWCYEQDPAIFKRLAERLGFCGRVKPQVPGGLVHAVRDDFLSIAPDPIYDRVLMNPPFARQADIAHVIHALRFLRDGGRLVSIMSAGVLFRTNRAAHEFRTLVANRGGSFTELPDGSFLPATGVRTVIVTVDG